MFRDRLDLIEGQATACRAADRAQGRDVSQIALAATRADIASIKDTVERIAETQQSRGARLNVIDGRLAIIENIPRDVKAIAGGFDWLFIDTPPADMDLIEQAIAVADVVVIPVKPGFFDVLAVQSVIEMCEERRKPFSFVLNAVDSRWKPLTVQTVGLLNELGAMFTTRISCRMQYVTAVAIGKTGPELGKDLKSEFDGLWAEVKRLVEKGRSQ